MELDEVVRKLDEQVQNLQCKVDHLEQIIEIILNGYIEEVHENARKR